MRYQIVVEESERGYGAHVPDLPGCVAAGATRQETLELIQEAVRFHVEGLREAGETVPSPSAATTEGDFVEVDAA